MEGKEELVSSWQDLRGRSLLTGEHKFEIIAGGRHADVVALDGGMEAFAALSCVKTDDHHAGGFMTGAVHDRTRRLWGALPNDHAFFI